MPPAVEIYQVEVLMFIMVGGFRMFYKDQVVDFQVLQLQIARHQVMPVGFSFSSLSYNSRPSLFVPPKIESNYGRYFVYDAIDHLTKDCLQHLPTQQGFQL